MRTQPTRYEPDHVYYLILQYIKFLDDAGL